MLLMVGLFGELPQPSVSAAPVAMITSMALRRLVRSVGSSVDGMLGIYQLWDRDTSSRLKV